MQKLLKKVQTFSKQNLNVEIIQRHQDEGIQQIGKKLSQFDVDVFKKKFKQDGIKYEEFVSSTENFQNCLLCCSAFTNSYYANLLECGHFLCQQCCSPKYIKTCIFPHCKRLIAIKKLKYWPFMRKKQNFYDFALITDSDRNKCNKFQNISEECTIKELISKDQNGKQMLSTVLPHYLMVLIAIKNYSCSKILNKKIKDLAKEAKIDQHRINMLYILKRGH